MLVGVKIAPGGDQADALVVTPSAHRVDSLAPRVLRPALRAPFAPGAGPPDGARPACPAPRAGKPQGGTRGGNCGPPPVQGAEDSEGSREGPRTARGRTTCTLHFITPFDFPTLRAAPAGGALMLPRRGTFFPRPVPSVAGGVQG
jgi:hypothetical protein